jgi:hypothetical protein
VGLLAAVVRVGVEALLVLVATGVVVMAVKTVARVEVTSREAKVQRAWMLRLRSNAPLAQRASATVSVAALAVARANSPAR